ncbi:putative PE family protein PE23 [Mycobacterium simulans]|uniref:Putative PE family protein PE23 n=1 Tax=Mycobacterium simulans TaxID=627089 RepID=A0A7Z7IPP3_9MYCO|nr:outer membrane porin GjpA [Mycobacterium simulans]SOJ57554.1 putative PE family protein PE23 [Mycobacterium simulans]
MPFVIATPELMHGAAERLAGIGSSLAEATATVSGPTTGIAAAAADEVSIAIASMFGEFGEEFQALSSAAQTFHTQFVDVMNSSVGAYASAEVANAQQTLLGGKATSGAPAAAAASVDPITRWQQVFTTTSQNAQKVFGASQQALNTVSGGVSAAIANPTTLLGNLQNAAQSVALIGAPNDLTSAVTQHTLGGITEFIQADGSDPIPINDAHVQLYEALLGNTEEFSPTGGLEGLLLTGVVNLAASPMSGVLMGAVGPFVSPGVALLNSMGNVFADLTGGNPTAALYGLINTPADVVDAFFNGATLNLDALAPVINPFVSSGTGGAETLTGLSLGFGGLFSPGQVVTGASGPMYDGVGGSLFNSLGVHLAYASDEFNGSLTIAPAPVGPIGATAGLISIIGHALGGSLQPPPAA